MADKFCTKCGARNLEDAKFCIKCGNIFPIISSEKICTKCGTKNLESARFCISCGIPFESIQEGKFCVRCGYRNSSENAFCVSCGYSFNAVQQPPVIMVQKTQPKAAGVPSQVRQERNIEASQKQKQTPPEKRDVSNEPVRIRRPQVCFAKIEFWCAVAVIISFFFLPWLGEIKGLEIAKQSMQAFKELPLQKEKFTKFVEDEKMQMIIYAVTFVLIPVFSGVCIISDFFSNKTRWLYLLLGVLIAAEFLQLNILFGSATLKELSLGAYITYASGALLILTTLKSIFSPL